MKTTKRWKDACRILPLLIALGALNGCTTYVEERPRPVEYYPPQPPPPVVEAPAPVVEAPPPAEVVIHAEADFYGPLGPYGRWVAVGGYGRCWVPGGVAVGWRPYCNGHWERTDAGWYWVSDEPWGWATYHYGRWGWSTDVGWYWVPHTVWAPAWVSWHRGGGYVGWAPLLPTARVSAGAVEVDVRAIPPRSFVFVEERHFLEPVRPTTVVVNNTTIINKTVNITNIKVVNNTVINEGPRTQVIEQASGRKVQAVAVHDLRRKAEAPVVARQARPPAVTGKPERPQGSQPENKAEAGRGQGAPDRPAREVSRPPANAPSTAGAEPKKPQPRQERQQVNKPAPERPLANKPPGERQTGRSVERPKPSVEKAPQNAEAKPAVKAKHERLMKEQGQAPKGKRPEPKKGKPEEAPPERPREGSQQTR